MALMNTPCLLGTRQLKIAGNENQYSQTNQYIGSEDYAFGLPPTIRRGATVTTTRTHYGAMPGDAVHVLYNSDKQGYPAGVVIRGWVSAPDTVSVSVTNNTGRDISGTGAGTPVFLVERRY
jgi:hypothetical protein